MEQNATAKPAGIADKINGNANGGKYQQNYKKNIHSTNEIGKEARFEGREEKLKGHIGADVRQAILKMEIPTFPTPTAPPDGADSVVVCKWEKRIDGIIKREDILEANMKTLLSLIWGQCTELFTPK